MSDEGANLVEVHKKLMSIQWEPFVTELPDILRTYIQKEDAASIQAYLDVVGVSPNFIVTGRRQMPLLVYAVWLEPKDVAAHLKVVETILMTPGVNVHGKDRDSQTSMHHAVGEDRGYVIPLLIKYGADLNAPNWRGCSPLVMAASVGNLEITRILAEAGANIGMVTSVNESINTYLWTIIPTRRQACRAAVDSFVACCWRCQRDLDKHVVRAIVVMIWVSRRQPVWDR